MSIELMDDGTLDTVLRCSECGEEFRFNNDTFDPDVKCPHEQFDWCENCYDDYIQNCIDDVEFEHYCEVTS